MIVEVISTIALGFSTLLSLDMVRRGRCIEGRIAGLVLSKSFLAGIVAMLL